MFFISPLELQRCHGRPSSGMMPRSFFQEVVMFQWRRAALLACSMLVASGMLAQEPGRERRRGGGAPSQIGRGAGRGRGEISGVGGSFKKKKKDRPAVRST